MSTRREVDVDVAIVGGGPVGLTLGLLLRRLGVSCTVLEAGTAVHPLPRAVHLDDEALFVLTDAGVAGAFALRPIDGMALVDADLRAFVTFDRSEGLLGHPASVLMHQPDLEQALRDRAAGILRTGICVTGLRTEADHVVIEVEGDDAVTARWAVGCDGASSAVRELAGFEMDDLGFRQRWLVVDLHGVAAPPGSRVLQVCDPDRPATSVPVGGGRHRFEIRVGDDERIADPAARAMELVEPCVDVLGLDPAGVERAAVYEFRGRLARTFRRGRILLAGDAAHQMPPFLGQGLCTGIRDVANLAWKLAYVVDGRATPDLLDTYTEERRPHARRAIRLSATVGRIVSDRQPVRAAVRNRLLAFGERILPTGSLGAIGVPPLPSGPLVDRGGVPHPGTGVWGRVGTFARGLGSDVGRPFDSDVPLREGSFAILGASGAVAAGLPPALRRWWERLGAACLEEDPATVPPATPPQIAVVRPDGFLLGRYPLPSQGGPSPLCDVAVRLSAAGIRAPG